MFVVKIISVRKGFEIRVVYIVVVIMIIALIVMLLFMKSGLLEQLAYEISQKTSLP